MYNGDVRPVVRIAVAIVVTVVAKKDVGVVAEETVKRVVRPIAVSDVREVRATIAWKDVVVAVTNFVMASVQAVVAANAAAVVGVIRIEDREEQCQSSYFM